MSIWLNKQAAQDKGQGNLGSEVQNQLKKGRGVTSEEQGNQYSQGMDSGANSFDDRKQDNLQKLSPLLFSLINEPYPVPTRVIAKFKIGSMCPFSQMSPAT